MEGQLCENCYEKFDENDGILKVVDMCKDCREKVVFVNTGGDNNE